MASHRKSHGLVVVGLALALLLAPGGAGARRAHAAVDASGIANSERPLGELSGVGDIDTLLPLAYSAAELRSRGDLEACDLGNRARMYSDGQSETVLRGEGPLQFANSKQDCQLRLGMLPQPEMADQVQTAEAPGPYNSASVAASGLAWTASGLLLSSYIAWWWH